MLNRIIDLSLRNRVLVSILGVVLGVAGAWSLWHLPIDAFPDTTPVQVQINTVAPALGPLEVEQQITVPVELAVGGLPGLASVRSISKFGLSQVVATFGDETGIYLARQLVSERLQEVELPGGLARPVLGPISTALGEVFHYTVTSEERSLTELREWQDWVIKPELRKVPGVAEINSWGGFEKQYEVIVAPEQLIKYGLTFEDVLEALEANNGSVGGGEIVRGGESILVHGLGLVTNVEEIGNIVLAAHDGVPIHVHDVGSVTIGHEIRRGSVTAAGKGETVLGLGFMLMGENSHEVTRALSKKLAEVQASLPPDIQTEVVYDRTVLIDKVIRTVEHNLLAGAALVIAVLLGFLGNFRAALIVAAVIPFSMLFTAGYMWQAGIAASLLSLGALDFGLIVDGAVIIVENCVRRLNRNPDTPRLALVREAATEVLRPALFGGMIIMIVFLPILTLEGPEGKLFKPMALTMMAALAGSLILSITVIPVLASFFLVPRRRDIEPRLVRLSHRLYSPILIRTLKHRRATLAGAVVLVASTALIALRMGSEFLPKLGEEAVVISTVRLSGVSVDEATAYNTRIENLLLEKFPDEIAKIWTRLGTAEVATDPMGIELSDIFIALKPRSEWKQARTQSGLVARIDEVVRTLPGMNFVFSQPIEMRMNELLAGIRSDLGVMIYGDDLPTLVRLSDEVQSVLLSVKGAADVSAEQITGQPLLQITTDPRAIARHGIAARNVLNVVEAVGGKHAGEIREGQRRFPLVVRLPERDRSDPEALAAALIPGPGGSVVPLGTVTRVIETQGPATIQREWGRRRIVVQCNVRGRDVGSFVAEARRRIAEAVDIPAGYTVDWGGQFENLERARDRLLIVIPIALGLILLLLYLALGKVRDVLIVATGIPLSAAGGVVALALRGMPFTVSAAIGFVALSGVAILNGLVLVTFIQQRLRDGMPAEEAVGEACRSRLRPVLMTALVAAVGFIPMALNTGVGAEVQRPLATVVIGGVLSSMLLTLVVLPAIYILVAGWAGKGNRLSRLFFGRRMPVR